MHNVSEPVKIVIVDDKRSSIPTKWSNTVSTIGLVVAIIAFIFTYKLFYETKNEFEIQNRPFIQIADVKVDTINIGLVVSISNMGNLPAKVIHGDFQIGFDNSDTILPSTKMFDYPGRPYKLIVGQNLTANTGFTLKRKTGIIEAPLEGYNEFLRGKKNLFLKGTYTYLNYVNNKPYKWLLTLKVNYLPSVSIDYIRNEEAHE